MKKTVHTTFETERLILRPWSEEDAASLYKYACDAEVGPPAGWPPHDSVEFSRQVIREVFSAPYTFAVVLKETGEPVGCCGLVPDGARPDEHIGVNDAEIGYWIGRPFWGNGLIPEAVRCLMQFCFCRLNMNSLWVAFNETNQKSRRVAEKCGFSFHHVKCGPKKEVYYRCRCTEYAGMEGK